MTARPDLTVTHDPVDEPDDGDATVYVSATVIAPNGSYPNASMSLPIASSDEELASALLTVAMAAAQMYSSGVWMALQQRVGQTAH